MAQTVAKKREVLLFYTRLLRGEFEDAKVADLIKAAEFFSKYYGLIDQGSQKNDSRVVIIDDISQGGEKV